MKTVIRFLTRGCYRKAFDWPNKITYCSSSESYTSNRCVGCSRRSCSLLSPYSVAGLWFSALAMGCGSINGWRRPCTPTLRLADGVASSFLFFFWTRVWGWELLRLACVRPISTRVKDQERRHCGVPAQHHRRDWREQCNSGAVGASQVMPELKIQLPHPTPPSHAHPAGASPQDLTSRGTSCISCRCRRDKDRCGRPWRRTAARGSGQRPALRRGSR